MDLVELGEVFSWLPGLIGLARRDRHKDHSSLPSPNMFGPQTCDDHEMLQDAMGCDMGIAWHSFYTKMLLCSCNIFGSNQLRQHPCESLPQDWGTNLSCRFEPEDGVV